MFLKHSDGIGTYIRTPEIRLTGSIAAKARTDDRHHSIETKLLLSEMRRKDWENPVYRANQVEKQRIAMRKRLPKVLKGQRRKPTKPEIIMNSILDRHFPGEWKYTGDAKVIIEGRNPDFVNINGKKAIIEVFGVYWHPLFDVSKTEQFYSQYGYKTLIVWEDELKDENRIVRRIKELCRK